MPVTGTEADAYYFRIVADYIHLNPARAGLAVYQGTSFVRSFEAVQIARNDGGRAVGIVTNPSADSFVVTCAAGSPPASIPQGEIKVITPLPVFLMPQGCGQILTSAELADNVSYLQSGR